MQIWYTIKQVGFFSVKEITQKKGHCLEYQKQYINVPDHIMKHICIKK